MTGVRVVVPTRGAGPSDIGLVLGALLLCAGVGLALGVGAGLVMAGLLLLGASYLAGRG